MTEFSRRSFLRLFGAGAAGMVLDPELLLWKPGEKTIFLPAVETFTCGNQFITPAWIVQDFLHHFGKNLKLAARINQQYGVFTVEGAISAGLLEQG